MAHLQGRTASWEILLLDTFAEYFGECTDRDTLQRHRGVVKVTIGAQDLHVLITKYFLCKDLDQVVVEVC